MWHARAHKRQQALTLLVWLSCVRIMQVCFSFLKVCRLHRYKGIANLMYVKMNLLFTKRLYKCFVVPYLLDFLLRKKNSTVLTVS